MLSSRIKFKDGRVVVKDSSDKKDAIWQIIKELEKQQNALPKDQIGMWKTYEKQIAYLYNQLGNTKDSKTKDATSEQEGLAEELFGKLWDELSSKEKQEVMMHVDFNRNGGKTKDSDKEIADFFTEDGADYYGAIVAIARRANNPQANKEFIKKELEPIMKAYKVEFDEGEFAKAYSEFRKAPTPRPLRGDSKTKDEKIVSIVTPRWEGDIKIVDGTHFEMKLKDSDRWSFALHIAQADDHIINALKAKGVLKDNGRFFNTDSKTKDAKTANFIQLEKKIGEAKAFKLLEIANEARYASSLGARFPFEKMFKAKAANAGFSESIINFYFQNFNRDSKTKDALRPSKKGWYIAKNGKFIKGPFSSKEEAEKIVSEKSKQNPWMASSYSVIQQLKDFDFDAKDSKTTHSYKGYVLEWDNENNKIPAKIISPNGKVMFTYASGAEPTFTGFNAKVDKYLSQAKDSKTKDGNGYVAFYKNKRIEVYANSSYEAQQKAAKEFGAKKSYEVTVMLAEKDGKQVVHRAVDKKIKDERYAVDMCANYRKDTETCRSGCDKLGLKANSPCPFEYEGLHEVGDKLQDKCPCYK